MTKDFFKKKENIIYLIILLVLVLISCKQIFKAPAKQETKQKETATKKYIEDKESEKKDLLEQKLAKILTSIAGVEEAEVLVTYVGSEKIVPVYETKEETTKEGTNEEAVKQSTKEKNVAYEENSDGSKKVIVESNSAKEVEGVIVCVKGNLTLALKDEIVKAVATVTNVSTHKVKIFNK